MAIIDTGILAGEQRMLGNGELQLTDGGACSTSSIPAVARSSVR